MSTSTSSSIGKSTEKEKCAAFLYMIGRNGREIYNTWTTEETDQDKIEVLFNKFDTFCKPKYNVTLERYKFNTGIQQEHETLDEFVTEHTRLAKQCKFENLKEDMIRDRIVVGIRRPEVKDRLLREADLTFEKAMSICRADEESRKGLNLISTPDSAAKTHVPVHFIKKGPKKNHTTERGQRGQNPGPRPEKGNKRRCPKCGLIHEPRKCPAYGKSCNKCHKMNHYAKICRTVQKNVHEVNQPTEMFSYVNQDTFYVGAVHKTSEDVKPVHKHNQENEWTVFLNIRGQTVKAKIDTGAQANVMSKRTANAINAKIEPSTARLTSYSGEQIPVAGGVNLPCFYNNTKHNINFVVTPTEQAQTILGLETSRKLQLIQRVEEVNDDGIPDMSDILAEFLDTFGELGCLQDNIISTSMRVSIQWSPHRDVYY
ncbi:hypothetical protein RRG08_039425 [Elysia crispata]|uniref:Retrotransposon gag domain-containing protein n=1 Tax=Elysia crispata TaxID=231223 RepID=A0AAE1DVF4_9GAST|nr:hypothetical protein RRG08_039425 [Elysia crispata]